MIGSIIGAAAGVAGSLLGSHRAAKAKRERDAMLDAKEKRINDDMNYALRDRSQDAMYQNLLRQGRELGMDMVNRARGTQAVAGGTEESVAAAKKQAAEVQADTVAKVAAQAEAARQQDINAGRAELAKVEDARTGFANEGIRAGQQMANNFLDAGLGLVNSDIHSYLDSGRGVFENLFKKKNVK